MTLFRRINEILTANLHDLVDRIEDPEKMLRQAVRETDDAIALATAAAARAIASERLLAKQIATQRSQASRWQSKAVAEVAAGDDEQARRALVRRREHERLADVLEEQRAAADRATARLRRRIDAMKVKRTEAERMLLALAARLCSAQARRHFDMNAGCGKATALGYRFERLRQRVERAEAETEALLELTDDDWSLDRDAEEIAEIDAELLALRQQGAASATFQGP